MEVRVSIDLEKVLVTRKSRPHDKVAFSWDKVSKKKKFPRDSYEVTFLGSLIAPYFSHHIS